MSMPRFPYEVRKKMHRTIIYAVFRIDGTFYKTYAKEYTAQAQATRIGGIVRPYQSCELLRYD